VRFIACNGIGNVAYSVERPGKVYSVGMGCGLRFTV
jgi:hypothetical protein